MEIVITWYADSMQDQVIRLFENEYKIDRPYFEKLFREFYFHPFQKSKCILIVALDGDVVAGFQSFFYWPYTRAGKTYKSFQSGNSLVHPGYRGKGIFQKMLAFIDKQNKTVGVDFLMGFPVEASYKNFMKDKWNNILNLQWYVKPCNPFGFFKQALESSATIQKGCVYPGEHLNTTNCFRLSSDADFTQWRQNYMSQTTYFSFCYEENGGKVVFHLKQNKRAKVLNELVIGNMLVDKTASLDLVPRAFRKLSASIFRTFSAHFISIAINEQCYNGIKEIVKRAGFRRTEKSVYFIVKPFIAEAEIADPASWEVYRSDIDTW